MHAALPLRARATRLWPSLACTAMLLAACGQSPLPDDGPSSTPEVVQVRSAGEAIAGAYVKTLDPASLNAAEFRKVIGPRPYCAFRYTSTGHPVAVAGLRPDGSTELGVIKVNNHLVTLQPAESSAGRGSGFVLADKPVRISVQPLRNASASTTDGGSRIEANMIFEIGQDLKVGYGGFLDCRNAAQGSSGPK